MSLRKASIFFDIIILESSIIDKYKQLKNGKINYGKEVDRWMDLK